MPSGGRGRHETAALLESAYDSAFERLPFASLLPRIAAAIGADTAHLALWSPELDSGEIAVNHQMPEHLVRCYREHFWKTDNWRIAVEKLVPVGRAVAGHTIVPYRALLRSEMYNDALRAYGLFDTCCGRLFTRDASGAAISLLRGRGRPFYSARDVARLSAVLPHMAQAFGLRLRFDALEGRHAALDLMLDGLCDGALLLDHKGRLVHATEKARAVLATPEGPLCLGSHGRIVAREADAGRRLDATFAQRAFRGPAVIVFTASDLRLRIVPSALARPFAALPGVAYLAVIEDAGIARRDGLDRIVQHHRLTPAEARLARALVDGVTLKEAAARFGITIQTARNQLHHVLQKTGCRRQADLVRRCLASP
jgi:DNA-binding CsgD family transcriptional regulator